MISSAAISVSSTIQINDIADAMDEISARLSAESKALEGLGFDYYDTFGQVYASTTLTEGGIASLRENFSIWQKAGDRHGCKIDLLVENHATTHEMFAALQKAIKAGEVPSPIKRHVDVHRKAAWQEALSTYSDSSIAVVQSTGDDEIDARADVQDAHLATLIRTRAPDLDALREKVRIARLELGEQSYGLFTQLLADIDHLN